MDALGSLTLFPADLLTGRFPDGNVVEVTRAWADRSWPAALGDVASSRHPAARYVNPRVLGFAAVREHLRPQLPSGVDVACDTDAGPFLTQVHALDARTRALLAAGARVVVTEDEVAGLCAQSFPARGRGWLALFTVFEPMNPIVASIGRPEDQLLDVVHYRLGSLLDGYAAHLSDDALGLAAEMLAELRGQYPRFGGMPPRPAIDEAMAGARAAVDDVASGAPPVPRFEDLVGSVAPGLLAAVQPAPAPMGQVRRYRWPSPPVTGGADVGRPW